MHLLIFNGFKPSLLKSFRMGLFFLILILLLSFSFAQDGLTIAQWNVENLFDYENDPDNTGDDQYTRSGWTRWTEERYRLKLTNIAEVVSCMAPDILCLEEVENKRVLVDLQEVLRNVYNYEMSVIIHKDSKDMRGIDCAILSKYKAKKVKWLNIGYGSRPSPFAEFIINGSPLTVVGNHWKSRSGNKEKSDAKRKTNATKVRAEYQRRLKDNPSAAIIVAGDFNDNCDDLITTDVAGFRLDMNEVLRDPENVLFCLSSLLPEDKRGTYFYSQTKRWNSFDTINISHGLLPSAKHQSDWVVDLESYKIFVLPQMRMEPYGAPKPARRVGTKTGHIFIYGYSDHFPVIVKIKRREVF